MKHQRASILPILIALALVLSGCRNSVDTVASPACAQLDKVTDPAHRAELQKRCPRSGPAFQASPKVSY